MKTNKPALDIKIGKDRDVLYAKVRPHTKEFFELQKEQYLLTLSLKLESIQ